MSRKQREKVADEASLYQLRGDGDREDNSSDTSDETSNTMYVLPPCCNLISPASHTLPFPRILCLRALRVLFMVMFMFVPPDARFLFGLVAYCLVQLTGSMCMCED
jgi:hypothetical protein